MLRTLVFVLLAIPAWTANASSWKPEDIPLPAYSAKTITRLDAGISGSWFDPAKNFQGFTIQWINEQTLLATWFTFDTQGRQAWLQGIGSISGTRAEFATVSRIRGPRFGPGFNPADRQTTNAGRLTLEFSTCLSGRATYSGGDGLPADVLQLVRLSALAGQQCAGQGPPATTGPLHRSISGAWFEPAQDGQGWIVEMINDSLALLYWFSYDDQGNQAWFVSAADVIDNVLFARAAVRPVGGRFGPGYRAEDVQQLPWGGYAISFVGCGRAVARYVAQAPYGAGFYDDIRALAIVGGGDPCAFPGGLHRISGGLEAVPFTHVDGDTNDTNAPERANNTPAQVQTVRNPAIISGFASATPTGSGRFADRADTVDAFRVPLVAGQTLQLTVQDWDPQNPSRNDLDLLLFRAGDASVPVATSESIDRNEYITITQSGQYDVIVLAFAGSSNYTLVASYTPAPTSAQSLSMLDDFVEGEILVGFDHEVVGDSGELRPMFEKNLENRAGIELERPATLGASLYRIADPNKVRAALKAAGRGERHPLIGSGFGLGDLEKQGRVDLIRAIKHLHAVPWVRYAEPNGRVELFSASNDPLLPLQWHYPQIDLFNAWSITQGTPEVVVAVIDSGVILHADLEPNVRRNLGVDTAAWRPGLHSVSPIPGGDRGSAAGFHGTHVAGTIAAVANNSLRGAGVAPRAQLMPIQAAIEVSFVDNAVADAIYWASGQSNNPAVANPSRRADVINMSLGGPGACPNVYRDAIAFARNRGVIVVAAAGNETDISTYRPASCPGVVNVAAVNRRDRPASYSNCHGSVVVSAPGGETSPSSQTPSNRYGLPRYSSANPFSCRPDPLSFASAEDAVLSTVGAAGQLATSTSNAMGFSAGTSMAAPHVAGVAALMRSINPGLSPTQFDAELAAGRLTRRPAGISGWTPEYGYGIIDARRAVEAARTLAGGGSTPQALRAAPSELGFDAVSPALPIRISRTGSGTARLVSFNNSRALFVSGVSFIQTDASGFGELEVRVSRQGLIDGDHQGVLTFNTDVSGLSIDVPVRVRVGTPTIEGEAGFMYLLVYDAFTGGIVDLLGGSGSQGRYTFASNPLVSGTYVVVATSNLDFVPGVCTAGEYCATFPAFGAPDVVRVGNSPVNVNVLPIFPDISSLGGANAASAAKRRELRDAKSDEAAEFEVLGADARQAPEFSRARPMK